MWFNLKCLLTPALKSEFIWRLRCTVVDLAGQRLKNNAAKIAACTILCKNECSCVINDVPSVHFQWRLSAQTTDTHPSRIRFVSYVEGGVNTNCQWFLHAQTFQVTDLCHNLVNLIQLNVVLISQDISVQAECSITPGNAEFRASLMYFLA